MFDELIRQVKRKRGKTSLASESRRHAKHKTGQARVRPQLVQVTEEFSYSRSSGKWQPDPDFATGIGSVSVATSLDDNQSLAKPGRLDVRSLQIVDPTRPRIMGSFLTFHNHSRTDLEQLIAIDGGFDSIRLAAPAGVGRPAGQDPELGLQKSHQHTTYRVDQPTRLPIEATLNAAEGEPGHDSLGHHLYFLLDIKLYLPKVGVTRPSPRLGGIEFDWPWLTEPDESIRVWKIERRDYENPNGFDIKDFVAELDTSYDTTGKAIGCGPRQKDDSWFIPGESTDGAEHPYFFSLLIRPRRPLQLINAYDLKARVFVTFDSLMSGTEVRIHDAAGYHDPEAEISTVTLLKAGIELELHQAMAQRWSGQRNGLRFPGVQPSDEVIDTIKTAILACGYHVVGDRKPSWKPEIADFDCTIVTKRSVAGKSVHVDLEIRGHKRKVNRMLRGAGGPRLKEDLPAGDVEIRVLGDIEGDHGLLTSELNTLHDNLRSRLSTFAEA